MKVGLSRDYLHLNIENQSEKCCTYGSNQKWFGGMMERCGCGVISAADTIWYLRHGKNTPAVESYMRYVRKVQRHFLMLPFHGMPGISMAVCLNFYLRHLQLPYRARWGVLPGRIAETAAVMLAQDIPVPFCIGPCLARFWNREQKAGLKLYVRKTDSGHSDADQNTDAQYIWSKSVRSHFMVMTAIDGDWAKVSSWGETYYINLRELEYFAKWDVFGLMSNLVVITKKQRNSK